MTRAVVTWGIVLASTACSGGAGMASGDAHQLTLDVASDTIEAAQGSAMLVGANLLAGSSFAGMVTLSVDSPPAGLRAQLSGPQMDDGVTSELLAIGVDATVPLGAYPLTVRASTTGASDVTAGTIVLVEPPGTAVYTLQIRPVSVTQGDSVTALLDINRANFADSAVDLTIENAPPGVTTSLSPTESTKALAFVTIKASAAAVPGRYQLRVRGVASQHHDRVATMPLTVRARVDSGA